MDEIQHFFNTKHTLGKEYRTTGITRYSDNLLSQ
jgi:hypothetical protein